jgi:tetratricopeptide (TPR) repeat protein
LADKAVGMLQADNQQEALTCIDHAMSMNPQMPQFFFLHIVRSAALIGVGRYEEAVGECDQGLVHYPGNPELLKNKGIALKKLGRS